MTARKHILVVEDESHLAIGIKYNLEAEGYQVTHVTEGPAALRVVEEAAPAVDLVVLDLMLPGMSGYAVCESLRQNNLEMPILILSARTLAEDRTRGFEVGADQYLMKPFDLDELLSRVKGLLVRFDRRTGKVPLTPPAPATKPANVFSFGRATVNFETYQATVGEETVKLTRLEIKLLKYFIDHAERVIPRQELMENVWSLPGRIFTRAPDQFVRRLRKIFEPDPAQPRHFLTVRDAGYRFVAAGEAPPEEEGVANPGGAPAA